MVKSERQFNLRQANKYLQSLGYHSTLHAVRYAVHTSRHLPANRDTGTLLVKESDLLRWQAQRVLPRRTDMRDFGVLIDGNRYTCPVCYKTVSRQGMYVHPCFLKWKESK